LCASRTSEQSEPPNWRRRACRHVGSYGRAEPRRSGQTGAAPGAHVVPDLPTGARRSHKCFHRRPCYGLTMPSSVRASCVSWSGSRTPRWPNSIDSDKAPQTTVNSSDLAPTRPKLSAIWIVTLWRPRGSSASSTVTPDALGLACASIRLVMSMPREPYLTRRLFTSIVALLAG
jgi:hypothetical protein